MFFNYVSWSMDRRWMLALVCSPCIYRFYHHHQDDDDDDEYLTLSVNLFLFPLFLFCFVSSTTSCSSLCRPLFK